MGKEVTIAPENLEVANAYLSCGDVRIVANELSIPPDRVATILGKREVKAYVDSVFMDSGYRNRARFFDVLDEIIESKLEEARETEMFTKMDLMDILTKMHSMKMAELKLEIEREKKTPIQTQINTQINSPDVMPGNYGALMQRLLKND